MRSRAPFRLLAAFLAGVLLFASAASAGEVFASAALGFRGRYRATAFTPLRVEIENLGETAWFRVRIPLSGMNASHTVSARVQVPQGARKRLDFTVAPPSGLDLASDDSGLVRGLRADILDDEGRIREKAYATAEAVDNREFVLLCGRFRGRTPGEGRAEVTAVRIHPEELPSSVEGLDGVSAVVLADAGDALKAFPGKAAVLRQWVVSGGRLIAWGGAAFFRSPPAEWEGFVPPIAKEPVAISPVPACPSENVIQTPGEAAPVAPRLDDSRGSRLLWDASGALGVRVIEGTGAAAFLALDPGSPSLQWEWAGTGFWRSCLFEGPTPSYDPRERWGDWSSGFTDAVCNRGDVRLPTFWTFLAVFLVFCAVVGPGISLAIGRRRGPAVWIAVPLLSAAVSAGAYAYALRGRPGDAGAGDVRQLTFVDCTAEGTAGHFAAIFGLFSPNAKRYEIGLPGTSGALAPLEGHSYGWRDETQDPGRTETDALSGSLRVRMDPFSARAFRAAGALAPAAAASIEGGFRAREAEGRIRIANRTSLALDGGWILRSGDADVRCWRFGALPPGGEAPGTALGSDLARESFRFAGATPGGDDDPYVRSRYRPPAPALSLANLLALTRSGEWFPHALRVPADPEYCLVVARVRGELAPVKVRGQSRPTEEVALLRCVVRVER